LLKCFDLFLNNSLKLNEIDLSHLFVGSTFLFTSLDSCVGAGNIRVFCRCRPLSASEIAMGSGSVAEFESAMNGDLIIRTGTAGKKLFKFDQVFSPDDGQGKKQLSPKPLADVKIGIAMVC